MSLTVSTLSRREVVTHGAAGFPRARSLQRWHDTLNEEEGATPVALGLLDGGILVAVLLATCSRKRARCVALEVGRGVEIDVEDGRLTLCGERKRDIEPEEGTSFRSERTYGAFRRSFSLPRTVDAARISASHKDGILEIVLPKLEQAKPKRVEIVAA